MTMTPAIKSQFAFVPFVIALWMASIACSEDRNKLENSTHLPEVSNKTVDVNRSEQTLLLSPTDEGRDTRVVELPRLYSPIRSIRWSDDSKRKISFSPEPEKWIFSWEYPVPAGAMIEVVLVAQHMLPTQQQSLEPSGDGSFFMHAHQATTHGAKLRFEPQWFKNTVGYWTNPQDFATWSLKNVATGKYTLAVLQGCGAEQGRSEAAISIVGEDSVVAELEFRTIDTGHFQNFRWHHVGTVVVAESGDYQLRISAIKIAKAALMDVRAIHLVKQAQ